MADLNILVVDDEPGIRSGIHRILDGTKISFPFMDDDITYHVDNAASGEEALEMIDKTVPDVVLLDNKLPGIQGLDVLSRIKERQIETIVVMITSYASLEVAVRATRDGAYDFIPKPFTPQELRASMENITKQVFLRKMTRKMNTEGKQIRFQFLSVLSHELKTPLNAIEGYLKLMKDHQAGNNLDAYEDMIERSLERVKGMRDLIFDLLDLTRLESGTKDRNLKPVNLYKIAETSLDTLTPLAIHKDIKIKLESPKEVTIDAIEDEIEIIFNNLLSNAIKYNKTGGKVDFIIEEKEKIIVVQVKDTGIGMTADEMSKLFNEFSRIKNHKTRHISGSGLGLSIVKRLLSIYNAEIKVDSHPDKGSVFTIRFNK